MAITDFPRVLAALAGGALRRIASAIRRGLAGLKIINWIRRKFAPLTSTEAGILRQTATKYLAAGIQQNALPPGTALNPADVPSVSPGGMPQGATGSVQFDTRVNWRDQSSGREYWATIFIDAQDLLTNFDLLNAVDRSLGSLLGVSPPAGQGGEPISPSIIGFSVSGVVQA